MGALPLFGDRRSAGGSAGERLVALHHAKKGAGRVRAGQALRGSSEFHAWGNSNLYSQHVLIRFSLVRDPALARPLRPLLQHVGVGRCALCAGYSSRMREGDGMSWKRMNGRQRSRYLIGEAILRHVLGDTMASEHEAEVNTIREVLCLRLGGDEQRHVMISTGWMVEGSFEDEVMGSCGFRFARR